MKKLLVLSLCLLCIACSGRTAPGEGKPPDAAGSGVSAGETGPAGTGAPGTPGAGATGPVLTDTTTRAVIEPVEPTAAHLLYFHRADNMNRGKHDYKDVESAIAPDYYKSQRPARGEVVFYRLPDNAPGAARYSLSRIIGLPGERLKVEQGQVYINGVRLDAFYGYAHLAGNGIPEMKPMLEREGTPDNLKASLTRHIAELGAIALAERTIPDDSVFIVSDDWTVGRDSLDFGPLPLSRLEGKALGRATPPSVGADTAAMEEADALREAQRVENNGVAVWKAELLPVELFEIRGQRYARPVWAVTATYPAGNRTTIRFDALSRMQLSITENEAKS